MTIKFLVSKLSDNTVIEIKTKISGLTFLLERVTAASVHLSNSRFYDNTIVEDFRLEGSNFTIFI